MSNNYEMSNNNFTNTDKLFSKGYGEERTPSSYPLGPTPYQTLGVDPKDSIAQINAVYKQMIRVLHPDKGLTVEARNLGWTDEEKNEAFRQIKSAYKQIVDERKGSDYPDYELDYGIEEDYVQNLDRHGYDINDTIPENFNNDRFNTQFNKDQTMHEKNGFSNPFNRGYGDMFGGMSEEDRRIIGSGGARPNVKVETPDNFSRPQMEDGRIVNYLPKNSDSFAPSASGYSELGITKVSDFSTTVGCSKDGLCGSDLMSVYGKNNEYWEDSVKRDSKLYAKYMDNTRIEKKMNSFKGLRSEFNFEEVDPRIQKQLDEEAANEKRMDMMRNQYSSRVDNYYDQITQGRISYTPR